MAKITAMAAELRDEVGKGAARATRKAGRVPAVIYGDKQDPVTISIDPMDLGKQLKGPGFFARVFEIKVNGEAHRVLARDLQVDPVNDRPIHVDFMRFSAATKMHIDVEVIFENEEESPGLKRGGVLNIVRHTIELICRPDAIPESLTVDLTGLEIGDSIHISQIALPEDVELAIADRDFTIATVAAPSVLKTEEEEAAEAAEAAETAEGMEGEEGAEAETSAEATAGGEGSGD